MKKSYIVVAAVLAVIVAAIVLLRDPLKVVFSGSGDQKELEALENEYTQAQMELDMAQKAVERAEKDIEDNNEAAKRAAAKRDEAQAKLKEEGLNEEEIDALVKKDEQAKLRVEVIASKAQEISSGISLSGVAEASRKLEVRAETSGQVISEPIPSGSKISKDQVLCELDPGTSQAALDQALAAFETAKTQYASTLSLNRRGLASTAALQNANAALEQAQSGVDNARKAIERLQIKAPFDGVLENQTAELGELLQPGSICASIVALDRLALVGYASETQVDKIRLNAPARGIFRDERQLDGQVSFVAASADPTTRTFRTEVSVANPGEVRDGSSVKIVIALAGTNGHLIPQNALTLNDQGDLGVKINQEGIAEFVPVEMVRDTPQGIWVTGLPDEVEIIVSGQEYAVSGQPIEATKITKEAMANGASS